MKLTKQSIKNPATVAVIAALVLLLGAITLFKLPVQLFPNIETPEITIATFWRAAAPSEMESEIAKPIEEVMAGIPGMEDMFTFTNQGNAFINMEFSLEADMDQVMLEVISRLNRLPAMPADSEPPQVMFGGFGGANESLIWYFAQNLQGEERLTVAQEQFLDDTIIPRIEAIEGVSGVNLQRYSSNGEQLHIVFDPYVAADLGIDLTSIAGRIGRTSDVSGGIMDVGKRQYTLRFKGGYNPEQLAGVILEWRNGQPIRLGDIATITVGPGRQTGFGYQNGRPAVGFQILKASGANVLTTLDQVKSTIDELNPTLLAENGIRMDKSFDPSVFIMRAINMLSINMGVGILLAIGILWWFLRQMRATLLIALAIPISIFATFLVNESFFIETFGSLKGPLISTSVAVFNMLDFLGLGITRNSSSSFWKLIVPLPLMKVFSASSSMAFVVATPSLMSKSTKAQLTRSTFSSFTQGMAFLTKSVES